jgi:hypothetical protein
MKALRRVKLWAGVLVALAAVFVAVTLLTARPADPDLYPPAPGEPAVVVYVLSNSLHANLALPASMLTQTPGPTAEAVRRLAPAPWVHVGWGDARFYQGEGWSPARVADGARALFMPGNPSVVRLGGAPTPAVDAAFPKVVVLTLSDRGAARLRARLDAAFALEQGQVVTVGRDGPNALFFKGAGDFSILNACTQWLAGLLNAAGVPVTPALDVTAPGLALDLRQVAGAAPLEPSRLQTQPDR